MYVLFRAALLLVLVCQSATNGFAATYYVNANGGHDGFSGTSPLLPGASTGPWQTLGKLANATLAPGDTVYLACGSVWNETLQLRSSGAVNVPITIEAGPGTCAAPPTISGAYQLPAHAWVRHSGAIYRATLPIDFISNTNPGSSLTGWAMWSANGDANMASDYACPGQSQPCMAFIAGSARSIAISNNFPVVGGATYTAGVQIRAPAGTPLKVIVRRGGPTYESLGPDQLVTAAGVWQSVGLVFAARSSAPNARIDIEVPGNNTKVHIREVHIKPALLGAVVATHVGGRAIRPAHHPNFGYDGNADSPYAAIASDGAKTTVDTAGLALPPGATLQPGLGVTIRTNSHAIEESTVASVSGTRLNLTAPTTYPIETGFGFYLTDALWMVDSPGEWYYDKATATVYAWMPDSAAPGDRVSVSGAMTAIDVSEKKNIVLKNIRVRHVGAGVSMTGSSAIQLQGVDIADVTDMGVNAANCAQCAIRSSAIARTGLDAVRVVTNLAAGFSLTDSVITDAGASRRTDGWRMLPRPAQAAVYAAAPNPTLLRNTIDGAASIGVFLGVNSQVADNYFGNTCLTHNDCGAIYAHYLGNNANIRGNLVELVSGSLAGVPAAATVNTQAVGIYIDDLNTGSVISANTVTGADYGIKLHNASGASIDNNVLFGNRVQQLWLHEQTRSLRAAGDVFGNTVTSNTLVQTTGGPAIMLHSELGDASAFGSFSMNHYSALLANKVIGRNTPAFNGSFTLAEFQSTGQETGGRVTQSLGYAAFLTGLTNIIPNGALTNGFDGWTWWSQMSPQPVGTMVGCGGPGCLQLIAGFSPSQLSSPNFSVTEGQWYRVSFDVLAAYEGQPIAVLVRRGGGGTASYEPLMPASENFVGSASWRRFAFSFQAAKTVIAGNPLTQELGARVDFQRIPVGASIVVANLEMVSLTAAAQSALQIKMPLNRNNVTQSASCASIGAAPGSCGLFVHLYDDSQVAWPATLAPLTGIPVYTRDTTFADGDLDGIADLQDKCPNSPSGKAVNARGCALGQ
jgi:parallel beta-helix repeat protein